MNPADSDLEFLRAQEGIRRGWILRDQVSELLRDGVAGAGLLDECRRRGWMDGSQVRRLRDASLSRTPSPPEEDDPIGPGSLIAGRYRVERALQGGFGRVYLCRTPEGERAALKTLLRRHLDSLELRRAFVEESRRWIALGRHPHLVAAFGLEEHLRLPFLVLECIEGGRTLGDRIDEGLSWREALAFGLQIARGLAHAGRSAGLVHRDLKPGNVLVDPSGVAKVSDFGLALVRGEHDASCCGTPAYMPPEQWSRPREVDVRSDVYAFGVLLFETLTGRLPFRARTLASLEAEHRLEAPPNPSTLVPELPGAVARLVLRCLKKSPSRRFPDFDVVAAELAAHVEAPAPAPAPVIHPADDAVNRSCSAVALGRPEDALSFADAALRHDPRHLGGLVAKANALAALERLDEAARVLRDAASIHPGSALPLVNLAYVEHRAGRPAQALAWLDQALPVAAPRDLEGCVPILLDAGRMDEARDLIERILEEDPQSVPALTHQAVLRRRLGDPAGALESLDRALKLNPRHAKSWSNRAAALVQLGRFGEAVESAQRALEIDPALQGAFLALAAALMAGGRRNEARSCLEDGLRRIPGSPLLQRAIETYGL
jgi:tetratricopeptide (TPR) repeat protein